MTKAATFKFKRPPACKARLDAVLQGVEAERQNLGVAISILACLGAALEHGEGDLQMGICYHDVARHAMRLVANSMEALEPQILSGGAA